MNWQPIETAPKDGREILTYGKDDDGEEYFWVCGWWPYPTHEEGHWTCWHVSDWATHWMPLPEPPRVAIDLATGNSADGGKGENPRKV